MWTIQVSKSVTPRPIAMRKADYYHICFCLSTLCLLGHGTTIRFQTMGTLFHLLFREKYSLCVQRVAFWLEGPISRETYGQEVFYDLPDHKLKQATQWLIGNPNRINLGRIGLRYKGVTLKASEITNPRQVLDLWSGIITSTFDISRKTVQIVTQGDLDSDAVAISIESDLVRSIDIGVELDFVFPPIHST